MQRVLVIGSGGAGKSTFATRLAQQTGLPLVHLDALYWQPGWVRVEQDAWARIVDQVSAGERWIQDGNYSQTLDRRLAACDTVIFLDMPRAICLWRVVKRWLRFRGQVRPAMNEGCPEQLSWEFILWIWNYPKRNRPKVLERLSRLGSEQRAVILRADAEVEEFFGPAQPGSRAS